MVISYIFVNKSDIPGGIYQQRRKKRKSVGKRKNIFIEIKEIYAIMIMKKCGIAA